MITILLLLIPLPFLRLLQPTKSVASKRRRKSKFEHSREYVEDERRVEIRRRMAPPNRLDFARVAPSRRF